jgi:hypothetical protein
MNDAAPVDVHHGDTATLPSSARIEGYMLT